MIGFIMHDLFLFSICILLATLAGKNAPDKIILRQKVFIFAKRAHKIVKFVTKINMDLSAPTRPAIRIYKKGEEPDDVLYWLSRPAIERIRALEEIRKQYNDWKYGTGREFQRVYKIVKRKRR